MNPEVEEAISAEETIEDGSADEESTWSFDDLVDECAEWIIELSATPSIIDAIPIRREIRLLEGLIDRHLSPGRAVPRRHCSECSMPQMRVEDVGAGATELHHSSTCSFVTRDGNPLVVLSR